MIIFGPKTDEVRRDWRKLFNDGLHNVYSSLNIIRVAKCRRTRWAGYLVRMGEMRNAYNIFIGKPEGKRRFGRRKRRLEDDIKMNLREIVWEGVD
jgi:hypothetical protein